MNRRETLVKILENGVTLVNSSGLEGDEQRQSSRRKEKVWYYMA